MEKEEFITQLNEQIALAEGMKSDKRNVLNLRVTRFLSQPLYDSFVTGIGNIDFIWEFLRYAEVGYVGIYENLYEEGRVVFTGREIRIENKPKES